MNREALYEPFEIVYKKLDECPKGEHKHLFFELVYVLSGTGKQCINGNKFNYHADHMFLITPDDCHSFEIETTTEFFFLRFGNVYIRSQDFHTDDIKRLEYILQNASHQPGCILKNISDKPLVRTLISATMAEYVNRDLYNKELVTKMVDTMIVVVARNIAKYMPSAIKEDAEEKALELLNYIQANIYSPEKLRAESLSSKFGVSEHYFGKYFKKHTNETLQQYIANLRIRLVEARLRFSDMRINEIAGELGFTDESHLNKFFKSQKGVSPKAFRNKMNEAQISN
ncbi:AraC-like DNA-binding protein [Pedobacter cryoconitis]|uniref:AraC-like DNA-binding protein n=1 Tax=Pedobacter cryoconitis TaxID=188932 RepID=A0A7W8YS62_9SPHI|nr:AraC family transcriptional regulator [Pedobacter cryoconitis]MBB5620851.1 AraC-like DNA-binding protein [Pedobacter cryoconitis]MBB5645927.1 AraC-like DNA-binding protein [Pedobacter cryoconitis]